MTCSKCLGFQERTRGREWTDLSPLHFSFGRIMSQRRNWGRWQKEMQFSHKSTVLISLHPHSLRAGYAIALVGIVLREDHLYKPVLGKTCAVRREVTYKWFASLFAS